MSSRHKFTVADATRREQREVEIVSDRHGFTVNLAGVEESIVIDLADGQLRVFITNANGDVPGEAVGALGERLEALRFRQT